MNEQEQRIAIAEACGVSIKGDYFEITPGIWAPIAELPDYLNDLNAMHEVENYLKHGQRKRYETFLNIYKFGVFSSAHERAEAFLKTLNLWKP